MLVRYTASFGSAALVTLGLLLLMQFLILVRGVQVPDDGQRHRVDFVRIIRDPPPPPPPKPEIEPDVKPPPPIVETGGHGGGTPVVVQVDPPRPTTIEPDWRQSTLLDGDPIALVNVAPQYPATAAMRDLEGYVIVEYTVTSTGTVRDVAVIEATSRLFVQAAVEAAYKFKYRPRVLNGTAVDTPGIRRKITFVLER